MFILLAGGLGGRKLSLYITKKFGRPSICVFILSCILAVSVVLLCTRLAADDTNYSQFGSACHGDGEGV